MDGHEPIIADSPPGPAADVDLPYRPSVGILVVNRVGLVWMGARRPKWAGRGEPVWQLPQGGILHGEAPDEAAFRELYEETGIRSARLIGEAPAWFTYELPAELVGVALKGKYRGQRLRWFLFEFTGNDSEIDIRGRRGKKAEFDAWKWAPYEELLDGAIAHRKPLYEAVGRALLPLVKPPGV